MAELVNLRRRRKQARRAAENQTAVENRLRSGLTKSERQAAAAESLRSEQALDAHLRSPPATPDRQS